MKKVPMRMCVVCRTMKPKKELIRVVKDSSDQIVLDPTGRLAGRGAYVCKSSCVEQLAKKKSFQRALNGNANTELFAEIERLKNNE